MLDALETLLVVSELGTMSRAATRLRVTQSAVSKRIDALAHALGTPMVERAGRNVRLTPSALALCERARPLLSELRGALAGEQNAGKGRVVLGVAESLLSSWAPAVLQRVRRALPALELELHAHRSPVALDLVRSGEYALAIVPGAIGSAAGLFSEPLLDEEMVVIGLPSSAKGKRLRALPNPLPVLSIERRSATFSALAPQLAALRAGGFELQVTSELESFAAVVQLARAGFGPALVPWALARALGVQRAHARALPSPGLRRPISLVGRKSALSRPAVLALRDALLGGALHGVEASLS
jgi:DNA-binding transcriptional LysR family regulator